MVRRVQDYVRNCLVCSAVKPHQVQPRASLKPHTPREPFETISIDILGPFQETPRGNKYVIIVEDIFSKWTEAVPAPKVDSSTLIRFLENEIFARYGYPRTIISDNARIFKGDKYVRLCQSHDITIYYSPVYHQQSNPVERRVQELKKVMRALLHNQHRKTNWDLQLPRVLQVLRGRVNAATGMSPSEVLLGYRLPREGKWEIPEYLAERQRKQARPTRLENVIRRHLDFQNRWVPHPREDSATPGPFIVTSQLSPELFGVEKNGTVVNIHIDDLRPAPVGNPEPNDAEIYFGIDLCRAIKVLRSLTSSANFVVSLLTSPSTLLKVFANHTSAIRTSFSCNDIPGPSPHLFLLTDLSCSSSQVKSSVDTLGDVGADTDTPEPGSKRNFVKDSLRFTSYIVSIMSSPNVMSPPPLPVVVLSTPDWSPTRGVGQ
ncbi:uncharacterized protein LOC111692433 [Anoplophora glabripennis]|uniref:uncharacterized protein LOC111692433 n=1 Tax=Anoplophora glabripennis TaxID=217634 RepID=UPI000C76FF64|nr:uncharacterized protein LOC111692433 [Anoplophora glabripennis]